MKHLPKIILSLIIIFTLSNCKAKKIYIEKESKRDSIIVTKTIVERFRDSIYIDSPCDSLGQLKPFTQVISTTQGKVKIQGLNNVITAQIDLKGYRDLKLEKFSESKKESVKEIVKYRLPFWVYVYIPFSLLLIGLLVYLKFIK